MSILTKDLRFRFKTVKFERNLKIACIKDIFEGADCSCKSANTSPNILATFKIQFLAKTIKNCSIWSHWSLNSSLVFDDLAEGVSTEFFQLSLTNDFQQKSH